MRNDDDNPYLYMLDNAIDIAIAKLKSVKPPKESEGFED
jgi:hypothetical protein